MHAPEFYPEAWVTGQLGVPVLGGWIKGVWMLFVVPLALWSILGTLLRLLDGSRSVPQAWRRLALPLVVVIAAGHLAKGVAKVASWGGYLPHALAEPAGVGTAMAITDKTMSIPAHLLPKTVVFVIGMLLMLTAIVFAAREWIKRLQNAGC